MAIELVETPEGAKIHVPLNLKRRSGRKRVLMPGREEPEAPATCNDTSYRDAMIVAIARAHRWKRLLEEGRYTSVASMAEDLGINRFYMARILRLSLLAPEIVEAIIDGREPDGLSLEKLRQPMPLLWIDQEQRLGVLSSCVVTDSVDVAGVSGYYYTAPLQRGRPKH